MANDPIPFSCPACGIRLTVPRELAGVAGPCPSCGSRIQAPQPPSAAPSAEPAVLKPEPRQLPARATPGDVVARPMPEPLAIPERRRVSGGPRSRPRWMRVFARLLMLVLFLLASGALVYGVLTTLKRQAPETPPVSPSDEPAAPRTAEGPQPTPPATASAQPAEDPKSDAPEALEPVSPWKDSEAVLEKFLAAKSLAERLPLIETRTVGDELAASCLASALPAVRKLVPELRETNPVERVVDCYFTVEFEATDRPAWTQTLLVRTRGTSAPKVVADPFLDTYGGRLAAYAAKPGEKAGLFQVVVYAVASCTDPSIPERDKKLTLKLLASDNTREIARAYFGRHSKISEMLEEGNDRLNYGTARACTVMLRWNTEDNPEFPYLEAIAIKDLDWNS